MSCCIKEMRGTEGYLQTQCQRTNTPTLMLHRQHPLAVPDLPPSLLLTEAEEQCTGTVMEHNGKSPSLQQQTCRGNDHTAC